MIETPYIDLFTQYWETIDAKSAPVLNNRRQAALDTFQNTGFPAAALEDYRHSDVATAFKPDYGLNIKQYVPDINPYIAFRCNVGNLPTNMYFLLNDSFSAKYTPKIEYPEGVFVGSLKTFAEKYPEACDKYYGKIAQPDGNGTVAFNTMFAQDGFVIYVPDNRVIEKPFQLINILFSNVDVMVNRRLLLIAGKNAQFKLLSCDHVADNTKFLLTQVTEIYAGENAHIDFYELEENSDKATRLASTFAHQEKASNVLVNNVTLNAGFTRNNYHIKLAGEQADANVCGVVIAGKQQHIDNFVFIDHARPDCHSNQLFKYVLQDESTGVFCGRILVEPNAQKTIAYQSNNNLCSSPAARMYAKPQLEIYADDVKCSHGLTTGRLDEDALFYLRARGIPKDEARLMLMQAFTSSVLELIRIDELKLRLYELVEKRFRGEAARCGDCAICK
ncbi:MAG: Fe-S cluster assembly protein SufD [Prevotella sp.]|jgi:Fe-S cluster assembly protein SufD|nr:Fe-S cluster assembly protein SufD [Prevotella sp.]